MRIPWASERQGGVDAPYLGVEDGPGRWRAVDDGDSMKDVLERQIPSLALNNASSRNRRNVLFFLKAMQLILVRRTDCRKGRSVDTSRKIQPRVCRRNQNISSSFQHITDLNFDLRASVTNA